MVPVVVAGWSGSVDSDCGVAFDILILFGLPAVVDLLREWVRNGMGWVGFVTHQLQQTCWIITYCGVDHGSLLGAWRGATEELNGISGGRSANYIVNASFIPKILGLFMITRPRDLLVSRLIRRACS